MKTTPSPRPPLALVTRPFGRRAAALLLRVWWLPVGLGALMLLLLSSQLQAASPGWQGARISFSCLEDSVTPLGPVQADGEDTLALLALRIWATGAWRGVRPLSIDAAQQEATYNLLEDEASRLRDFTPAYPDSNWTPPIQARLGQYYQRIGRSSVALQLWDEAWRSLAGRRDRLARNLADRTVAQYATLLAQLGHADKLALILAECAGRSLPQTEYRELYRNAQAALSAMNGAPEWCYRCGSFSVGLVGNALLGTSDSAHAVARVQAPTRGFSLQQLAELSKDLRLDLVPMYWGEAKEIAVPSVVHWQDQHYSAILGKSGNWYVVMDPTLKEPRRLHRTAIEQEATGYFLAPRSGLSGAWVPVSSADAAAVIGRGYDSGVSDSSDEPGCPHGSGPGGYGGGGGEPQGGGGCGTGGCLSAHSPGVLEWFISEPYANLWLRDVPLRWQPAIGPEFAVRLAYRQRGSPSFNEMNPDHFTQVGSAWQLPWRGAIRVEARGEDGSQFMRAFTPTGSRFLYEFEGSGSTSGTHFINNSILERVIVGEELKGANVWYPDGSYDGDRGGVSPGN